MPSSWRTRRRRTQSRHLLSPIRVLNALPRTVNGKVDSDALPQPEHEDIEPGARGEPSNLTESILQEIWMDALGHRPGVDEEFFRIGGHSILATQVVAQIRERFEIEFPLKAMMDAPTIAGLATLVEAALLADIEGVVAT
ncbi:hypothetical protein EAH87_16065 [Sphingomonas koreensis]|nr:hypothetical protein EAH87_16065 [Sphingomonas koreensis]